MKPIRIAMWSGPRNISTTMMRSFSSRSDTHVTDEPFYAYYLKRSGVTHPGYEQILQSNTTDYDHIMNRLINHIPNKKSIWYQKHMAHHLDPNDNLKWKDTDPGKVKQLTSSVGNTLPAFAGTDFAVVR